MCMAESISKDQLKETLNEYVIIDVREPDEIENGVIENSRNMPLGLAIRNAKKGNIEELRDRKICVTRVSAVVCAPLSGTGMAQPQPLKAQTAVRM